jgi:hypothetical protein
LSVEKSSAEKPTAAYPGTVALGRPLTKAESKALSDLVRAHGFINARVIALAFGIKLMRSKAGGQDLVGRAALRLVRRGWDPAKVSLTKCLLRLVWSEWTHHEAETAKERKAVEEFLERQDLEAPDVSPSPEEVLAERAEEAKNQAELDRLRASFQAAGDEVNLLWLAFTTQGIDDLQEMATLSGRDVTEFYRAADRRKRHVMRLIAENRGVKYEEDGTSPAMPGRGQDLED